MKRFKMAGAVVGGLAFSLVSLGGVASAQSADDVTVLLDNLPTAAEELAAGLQETVDTLATTQSAVETSAAVGDTLVASGSALVQGSEQFGALALAFNLTNGAVQSFLAPYLGAIDDPSTAADVVNPDDLATLAGNVQPALDAVQDPAVEGAIRLLEGDLFQAAGFGLVNTSTSFVGALTADTNYEGAVQLVGIPLLVAVIAGMDHLNQGSEALAPAFEAAAPVTEPIITALQGI